MNDTRPGSVNAVGSRSVSSTPTVSTRRAAQRPPGRVRPRVAEADATSSTCRGAARELVRPVVGVRHGHPGDAGGRRHGVQRRPARPTSAHPSSVGPRCAVSFQTVSIQNQPDEQPPRVRRTPSPCPSPTSVPRSGWPWSSRRSCARSATPAGRGLPGGLGADRAGLPDLADLRGPDRHAPADPRQRAAGQRSGRHRPARPERRVPPAPSRSCSATRAALVWSSPGVAAARRSATSRSCVGLVSAWPQVYDSFAGLRAGSGAVRGVDHDVVDQGRVADLLARLRAGDRAGPGGAQRHRGAVLGAALVAVESYRRSSCAPGSTPSPR